nr:YtjB family periplasmic protein [Serratia microhaemolytica]
MARAKLKFYLHRSVLALICLGLMVLLMQGASYFSLNHQVTRSEQIEELAQTFTKQVAFSLAPLMSDAGNIDSDRIDGALKLLTFHSRILDASVYQVDGGLIAHAGEQIVLRDRLALDGKRPGSYFNRQLVEPIFNNNVLLGFLRVTLDTHVLATESQQVDNTTNMIRLMLILALVIGIVLARTLLQGQPTGWQQSPYLLTANSSATQANSSQSANTPYNATSSKVTTPIPNANTSSSGVINSNINNTQAANPVVTSPLAASVTATHATTTTATTSGASVTTKRGNIKPRAERNKLKTER